MKDPYAFDLLQKLRAFIDDANVDDAILAANLEHSIERYQRLVFKHGVRRIIECYGIRAIEVKYPDVKRAFRSIVMALIAFNGPKKIQVEGWNEVSAGILLSVNMKKMKKRKRISTKKAFGEEGKAVRL